MLTIRLKSSVVLGAVLLHFTISELDAAITVPAGGALPLDPSVQAAADKCRHLEFKKHLAALKVKIDAAKASADADFKKELDREGRVAVRVANDLAAGTNQPAGAFGALVHYTVPAMSNIKRLMHTYPTDGKLAGPVRIVAAKGEFEPATFVLYPFSDAAKVELKVSDLAGKNGRIPASAVDVKVIKIWYQTGNAWYSYYANNSERELVPELLLNDENLVKVDRKSKDDYLRVDYPQPKGSEYVLISAPQNIDIPFNDYVEPVRDAQTLQPFSLTAGEFKQLWLTFEAPKNAEGTYTGTIALTIDGQARLSIPLQVRVLPFELPDPKTSYDLTREFYTFGYNDSNLGDGTMKSVAGGEYPARYIGDLEKAKTRLFNEYVNMRKHNMMYPQIRGLELGNEKLFAENVEIYKKAGLRTDTIFRAVPGYDHKFSSSPESRNNPIEKQPTPVELYRKVDVALEIMVKAVGHSNIYTWGAGEPAMGRLISERKPRKYIHDKGLKTLSEGNDGHLIYGGYNEDFLNRAGYTKESADKWHAAGARITTYADPHTGPENPDFARRTHGMDLYMANLDGTCNYMLNGYPWNDFITGENLRCLTMIYPGIDAPIDTLEWEGFREGLDDVRYATLLKQLANKAIATGKTENVYQGRMALQWMALLDAKKCDLNAARLEMIAYILKLKEI
jgi:hypothetical protein